MISIWDSNKFRQARKDADMTAELARVPLNITVEYLSMIENGHRQPSQKLVLKMAEAYQKPVIYFLAEEKKLLAA